MEKVSVLMSVYRKESPEYLEESIDSLLKQTLNPNEIVIIKDGPLTSKLNHVLNDYLKDYPTLFSVYEFKENHGLAYALAYGVQHAKYEYIARMDSDDIAATKRLERQLKAMCDGNYDIYGGQIEEFETSTEEIIARREVPVDLCHIKEFAHRRNPMNHMTVMFRRSKILEIGNYHGINGFEDYELWVRAIQAGYNLGNSKDVFVYVRAGHDMMGRRGGIDYIKNNFKTRKAFKQSGFYNLSDFLITTFGMTVTSLIPNKLRYFVYYKLLRK